MKKLVSLLLAVCMCISFVTLFAACKDTRVGMGTLPDVYEISYYIYEGRKNDDGTPIVYDLTSGVDADGNVYEKVVYNYNELRSLEVVSIYGADDTATYYVKNTETNTYELVEQLDTLINSSSRHLDYTHQGWVISNDLSWKDYEPSEIDVSELEAEDYIKTFLGSFDCVYYKYTKKDSDRFGIIAVVPESDIVLYYGNNRTEDGEYISRFVVTAFETNQTAKYADLVD